MESGKQQGDTSWLAPGTPNSLMDRQEGTMGREDVLL